jgi:L-ribulose-5-phosphate 4-epimerase
VNYCNGSDLLAALKMMGSMVKDNHGNVSCLTGPKQLVIKPSGMAYEEIGGADLVWVDFSKGTKVRSGVNDRKPSVDLVNHMAIYRHFPEVMAICHTHSPYVVAYATAGLTILCGCTEQADRFGGNIYCNHFVSDPDEWGEKVKIGLKGYSSKAVLLGNHGGLTFADDPVEAVRLAGYLEDVAMKMHLARQLNVTVDRNNCMYSEDISHWHERYNSKYGQ